MGAMTTPDADPIYAARMGYTVDKNKLQLAIANGAINRDPDTGATDFGPEEFYLSFKQDEPTGENIVTSEEVNGMILDGIRALVHEYGLDSLPDAQALRAFVDDLYDTYLVDTQVKREDFYRTYLEYLADLYSDYKNNQAVA